MANAYQISFLKPLALARTEADKFVMLVDCKNLNLDKLPHHVLTLKLLSMGIYKCEEY